MTLADIHLIRLGPQGPKGGDVATLLVLRGAAAALDWLVVALVVFVPLGLTGSKLNEATIWATLAGVVIYHPVFEGQWGGTIGKLATGLTIVDRSGRPPGVGRAAVRSLFRLIEVNPVILLGLPAIASVLVTPNRQRIGDLIAGTYVLTKKDLAALKQGLASSITSSRRRAASDSS